MREPGRVAASIELLSECIRAWGTERPLPADVVLHRYFRDRRFIGAKDRGAIAERVYFIIRHYATLRWHAERLGEVTPRTLVVASLLLHNRISLPDLHNIFNGEKFSPPKLLPEEKEAAKALAGQPLLPENIPDPARFNYPGWLEAELIASLGGNWRDEMTALNEEAPVDLRANTLLTTRDELLTALRAEGYEAEPTPLSPVGLRMKTRAPIFTSAHFKQGWFEMQDEGSQVVSLLGDARPGEKVIDFCAGAGGKTLALAAEMKNKGRILAWDTSQKRLGQMPARLKRAKVDNVQIRLLASESDPFIKRHKDSADLVFVDAPCTGLGTWRRNPDLKWRLRESAMGEIRALQSRILASAARLVKRGGRLLYVTCSLLESENEKQIEAFLQCHEKFMVVSEEKMWNNPIKPTMRQGRFLRLTPHQDGTDGFFASLLQRCE